MKPDTYEPESGFAKGKQNLEHFGTQQNAFNADVQAQLAEILTRLEDLSTRLAALETEQDKNITRFGRCAAELDELHKEVDRLRLTAKLNTNTIDRLVKKGESSEGN